MIRPLVAATLLLSGMVAAPARAALRAGAAPVVVELFTSESCSSCPPADALLARLARTRPDVLTLDWHVTYWDRLGWRDPSSLEAATTRQQRYARLLGDDEVYTPEAVIDGRSGTTGSDESAVLSAIARSEAAPDDAPRLHVGVVPGGSLVVDVGTGLGAGRLLLVGIDPSHDTEVGGGENDGRRLHEVNVVRSLADLGAWDGRAVALRASAPVGREAIVLLQAPDGRILAAASSG